MAAISDKVPVSRGSSIPFYETTFILRQDLSPDEVTKATQTIIQVVESAGGKLHKKEYWGLRKLAYKINKNLRGHYVMLTIELPSTGVEELTRQYRMREEIIRFLTIRVEKVDMAPSIMMQNPATAD